MTNKDVLVFARVGNVVYEYWPSPHGIVGEAEEPRWYWHRKVNGRVTSGGNYASRRSARRELHKMVAREA